MWRRRACRSWSEEEFFEAVWNRGVPLKPLIGSYRITNGAVPAAVMVSLIVAVRCGVQCLVLSRLLTNATSRR
jgi:hypothetical protein